jgi:hypothetical protein
LDLVQAQHEDHFSPGSDLKEITTLKGATQIAPFFYLGGQLLDGKGEVESESS